MIQPGDSIQRKTVSDEGAFAILAPTPLADYADIFLSLANQYGIDPNWALAYLQFENGFGAANTFSLGNNNPWDMLCAWEGDTLVNWGASGYDLTGHPGFCYVKYPNMAVGLEAGFRQWRRYVTDGFITWNDTLCRAVSGTGPCEQDWVDNVITQANYNEGLYPVVVAPPPPPSEPDIPWGGIILALLLPVSIICVALGRGMRG